MDSQVPCSLRGVIGIIHQNNPIVVKQAGWTAAVLKNDVVLRNVHWLVHASMNSWILKSVTSRYVEIQYYNENR